MSEWKRNLDALLAGAEQTVRYPHVMAPSGPTPGSRAPLIGVGPTNAFVPSANYGGSEAECLREVKLCMKEIAQLRADLTAEKDCRGALLSSLTKRLKDDLVIDMNAMKLMFQRELKETELKWQSTMDHWDQTRQIELRRTEDIVKQSKAHERHIHDTLEELREDMGELNAKVVSSNASLQQCRLDTARSMEQEKGAIQHRMDLELQRYAELHRQQVAMISDTKSVVAKEVAIVAKTVHELVQQIWEERWGAVSRSINERLQAYQESQECNTGLVNDMATKVATNHAEYKAEVSLLSRDLKERVTALECGLPVTNGKVERLEKRLDASGELVHQVASTMDNARAMCEHAAGVATSLNERMGRLEENTFSRDTKVSDLETRCEALLTLDKLRVAVDLNKKSIERVELHTTTMKDTTDRCDRTVTRLSDDFENFMHKFDGIDKRVTHAVTRVEIADHRSTAQGATLCQIETVTDSLSQQSTTLSHAVTALQQASSILEKRTAMFHERIDSDVVRVQQRLSEHDIHLDHVMEATAKSDQQLILFGKSVDRLDKKVQRMDGALANSLENVTAMREVVDAFQKESTNLRRAVDQHKEQTTAMTGGMETRLNDIDMRTSHSVEREKAMLETLTRLSSDMKQQSSHSDRKVAALRSDIETMNEVMNLMQEQPSRRVVVSALPPTIPPQYMAVVAPAPERPEPVPRREGEQSYIKPSSIEENMSLAAAAKIKAGEEAQAAKKATDEAEAAAKRKVSEEVAAKKKAEEEATAKKKAEEEAAKKKADISQLAAVAKKNDNEEAVVKNAAVEVVAIEKAYNEANDKKGPNRDPFFQPDRPMVVEDSDSSLHFDETMVVDPLMPTAGPTKVTPVVDRSPIETAQPQHTAVATAPTQNEFDDESEGEEVGAAPSPEEKQPSQLSSTRRQSVTVLVPLEGAQPPLKDPPAVPVESSSPAAAPLLKGDSALKQIAEKSEGKEVPAGKSTLLKTKSAFDTSEGSDVSPPQQKPITVPIPSKLAAVVAPLSKSAFDTSESETENKEGRTKALQSILTQKAVAAPKGVPSAGETTTDDDTALQQLFARRSAVRPVSIPAVRPKPSTPTAPLDEDSSSPERPVTKKLMTTNDAALLPTGGEGASVKSFGSAKGSQRSKRTASSTRTSEVSLSLDASSKGKKSSRRSKKTKDSDTDDDDDGGAGAVSDDALAKALGLLS